MKLKILLLLILALSLFLRCFRVSDFLGFWFDQGRDAKEVWDFLYVDHKPFLVGPTTGIEGIFLGPFYYYLISPFYLWGGGDPGVPALALGIITAAAVYLIYRIGSSYFDARTGLLAALLYGLSAQFVSYNRWLSNPTALAFFSAVCFWLLLKIIHGARSPLIWAGFGLSLGLSLQLEAASAIFFIPASALILLVNRKSLSGTAGSWFITVLTFAATLLPQVAFNFRHQNILLKAFIRFLVSEKSFQPALTDLLHQRLAFYFEIFTNKFYFTDLTKAAFVILTLLLFIITFTRLPKKATLASLIWWLTPVLFLLFYHGNRGYVWDYYFTGVYAVLVILIAAVWRQALNLRLARPAILLLLTIFIFQNIRHHLSFFTQALPGYISLTPIISAVDWVYTDADDTPFNTDVYVPPVIPHAYDYVFLWRGTAVHKSQPQAGLTTRLYTLLEPDPGQAHLREAWLVRQAGYSSIETENQFGSIIVQRRRRFIPND